MSKIATLFNKKIVQPTNDPVLAIEAIEGEDVVVDCVIVSNKWNSSAEYKMLIAEKNETLTQAHEFKQPKEIDSKSTQIANSEWNVMYDICLVDGQKLYVHSTDKTNVTFRIIGKRFWSWKYIA